MTIEKLAVMVQKGFNAVDKRFDDTINKMATKEQVQRINNRLDAVIERYNEEIGGLKGRVRTLEDAMGIE